MRLSECSVVPLRGPLFQPEEEEGEEEEGTETGG